MMTNSVSYGHWHSPHFEETLSRICCMPQSWHSRPKISTFGHTQMNTCGRISVHPSGNWVLVTNRGLRTTATRYVQNDSHPQLTRFIPTLPFSKGHNSIAVYRVVLHGNRMGRLVCVNHWSHFPSISFECCFRMICLWRSTLRSIGTLLALPHAIISLTLQANGYWFLTRCRNWHLYFIFEKWRTLHGNIVSIVVCRLPTKTQTI